MSDEASLLIYKQVFAPLLGLPAWSVEKGQGSFLTMEFGEPHLKIREPKISTSKSEKVRRLMARRNVRPCGQWHLFIYCCFWRVMSDGVEIAHCESSNDDIKIAAWHIDGQLLIDVKVDPAKGTSVFTFDQNTMLETWPGDQSDETQWLLYLPSGDVFTYRADGMHNLAPGNQPPDQATWKL